MGAVAAAQARYDARGETAAEMVALPG
jgi:hypothetical protein